jgi:predicted type IV restriction endonuclease
MLLRGFMALEKIKSTVDQVVKRVPAVRGKGEEATKQALVLPMLDALGYDIWHPAEVCPEYEADFATKKAGQKEKVDLAILLDDLPRIYFEVKPVDIPLSGHQGQLARYFNATQSVSLAILTNGVEYWFFTDTGDANVMDSCPFFIANLDSLDQGLEVLARFHKSVFSPEAIREYATELNYTAKMVEFLKRELDLREREPSENFVRWILAGEKMYAGRVTANVVERFCPIAKSALQLVLRDIVRRSVAALDKEVTAPAKEAATDQIVPVVADETVESETVEQGCDNVAQRLKIITTERELESFALVKEQFDHCVLSKAPIFEPSARREVSIQLAYKDTSSYFCIYLNKPSWWALRLVTESRVPWVGFNVDQTVAAALIPAGFKRLDPHPWAEFRVAITSPQDLSALHRLVYAAFQKTIEDRKIGRDAEAAANAAIASV